MGVLRSPADGIHDVLAIQAWLDGDRDLEKEHDAPTTDVFPFLRLPAGKTPRTCIASTDLTVGGSGADIRLEIYRWVLVFPSVTVVSATKASWSWAAKGRQYNAVDNLLALLMVNRQIYHEARYVLYSRNSFFFDHRAYIIPFVVAMGPHNAAHLRTVGCRGADGDRVEDVTSLLQQYTASEGPDVPAPSVWNDVTRYGQLRAALEVPPLGFADFDEAVPFERMVAGHRRRRHRVLEYYEFSVRLGSSCMATITVGLLKKRYYG